MSKSKGWKHLKCGAKKNDEDKWIVLVINEVLRRVEERKSVLKTLKRR